MLFNYVRIYYFKWEFIVCDKYWLSANVCGLLTSTGVCGLLSRSQSDKVSVFYFKIICLKVRIYYRMWNVPKPNFDLLTKEMTENNVKVVRIYNLQNADFLFSSAEVE